MEANVLFLKQMQPQLHRSAHKQQLHRKRGHKHLKRYCSFNRPDRRRGLGEASLNTLNKVRHKMRMQNLRIQIEQQHLIQQNLIALRPLRVLLALEEEEAAHLGYHQLLVVGSRGPRGIICTANLLLYLCHREGVRVG